MSRVAQRQHVHVSGPAVEGYERVLTPAALEFVGALHERFNPRRLDLLKARAERQVLLDRGQLPAFLEPTADLRDRRVEITGPTDRKMVINALNSGAKVFMADFEDANAPTWANMVTGQANLQDAVRKRIELVTPEKSYRLKDTVATLMVRPRGWHLHEKHVTVNGESISASLFDFGLFFFHNAAELLR